MKKPIWSSKKIKSVAISVSLFFGTLLFCFILFEIIFKVIAAIQPNQAGPSSIPGLPYENNPSITFRRYDREAGINTYSHNAFRMRGKEVSLKKSKDTLRIAFLGDSVVHGGNVNQGQETPAVVERLLNQGQFPVKYEALNFGVASYSLSEYAVLMREKVPKFSPDIVIIAMCLNDYIIRDKLAVAGVEKNTKKSWWRERFQNLFRSHFYEFLSKTTKIDAIFGQKNSETIININSLNKLRALKALDESDKDALIVHAVQHKIPLNLLVDRISTYTNPAVWLKNKSNITNIIRLAKSYGAEIYFFAYPLSEQIIDGYESYEPQETLKELVETSGGKYIELLNEFRTYQKNHPQVKIFPTYDNMHMFKHGHEIVAKKLMTELLAQSPSLKTTS